MRITPSILVLLAGCWLARAESPELFLDSRETPAQHNARMAWWRDARFGLFIHWGVYSVPAGEWSGKTNYTEWFLEETTMPVSQYEKFAGQFNPAKFDATEWVRLAKGAGMKYIVITSKHHDGFGMFRSDLTDWCVKSTPFQRDPLKELAAACKKQGMKLCFYHSIMDWHHPDWGNRRPWNDKAGAGPPNMDRYTAYLKGQLKELLTRYGPIGVLWFDGEWEKPWTDARGADLFAYVRSLQPHIIVNNRVSARPDPADKADSAKWKRIGDYNTPEEEIPAAGFGPGVDWESCMTMNDHWGYNKNAHNWKSGSTLVRNLIDCASKGGNYLLNIGPTAEGVFPEASVKRLAEIGAWMKVNSDAIYGTTASPFAKSLPWGRCTMKTSGTTTSLYLHVFEWPGDGALSVPGLKNKIKRAYLLADPKKRTLATKNGNDGVTIWLPPAAPNQISSTIVLKIKGTPDLEPPASYAFARSTRTELRVGDSSAQPRGY
jgi:alpha-L-fucosidase